MGVMSGPELGAIFVHFHTPEFLARAVSDLRRDWSGSGLEGEIIVVDNGNDAAGRRLISQLSVNVIDPESNLGFAAAANLGAAEALARGARVLLFINPDAFVVPGCSAALCGELSRGAAAAGPLFFWDHEQRFLLPPTERRTRTDELLSALSARGETWASRARKRWRRHAQKHWLATSPLATAALSGGLLAISHEAWQSVGPFDEDYRLYFEETDWLLRLVQRGGVSRLVPAAHAVHLHGRSAVAEPAAASWFEESAARFRRRFYGERFASLLARAAVERASAEDFATLPPYPAEGLDLAQRVEETAGEAPFWLELSPRSVGFPAAAQRFDRLPRDRWKLPIEVAERLAGAPLWIGLTDGRGRELGRWVAADQEIQA